MCQISSLLLKQRILFSPMTWKDKYSNWSKQINIVYYTSIDTTCFKTIVNFHLQKLKIAHMSDEEPLILNITKEHCSRERSNRGEIKRENCSRRNCEWWQQSWRNFNKSHIGDQRRKLSFTSSEVFKHSPRVFSTNPWRTPKRQ